MGSLRQRLTTIRFKAMGVVFALVIVLVAFLTTYFPARQIESVREAMRNKAVAYAALVAKQVEPGLAFDDRQTVREVFAAATADQDVRGMALYDEAGGLVVASGQSGGGALSAPGDARKVEILSRPAFIRATVPVVSREGPRGTLVVELSTRRLETDRVAIQRTAILVGLAALALGFAAAWIIGRSLGRRIGAIAEATRRVAAGDLSERLLDDASADEVGQLARSFRTMSVDIRELVARIRETSARENDRLDDLVRARTRELDVRNADLRLVLDNVNQGLLVVERSGCMATERSAVVGRWFGEADPGLTFWDYLARYDEVAALTFRLNWEALLEGSMPEELSLDQLPRGVRAGDRELELDYTPLLEPGAVTRVLVVVSDVTRRRAAERAEAEQREMVTVFERVALDRTAFLEFFDDASTLVRSICDEARAPRVDVLRWIHTLKGNASFFGMSALAALCHDLEDSMAESGADLAAPQRADLLARWRAFGERLAGLLVERRDERIVVDDVEYDALLVSLLDGHPRPQIARAVASWTLELASERLTRHAAQARSIGERLGLGNLEVTVDAGRLRLSREALAPVWGVFTHVVRNAVAHGLEPAAERLAAGKAPAGSLRLSARRTGGVVTLTVADDGRGIDWDDLARRAAARGVPCSTIEEREAALFCDGVSTRDSVDDLAGRGVGLGAVLAECVKLGGTITVESVTGRGTTVRLLFPVERVGENAETQRVRLAERSLSPEGAFFARGEGTLSVAGEAPP